MTSLSRLDRQPSHNAFVGRERELAELCAGLDDVCSGHGRLFLLSGEPGIGKTRLADEFARLAAAQGARVVWGRCWEGGGAPAYWPLVQIIRGCLAEADGEQRKAILGSETTPQIVQDLAQLLPELGAALAPAIKLPRPQPSDPQQARFRLFESVAKLLKNVSCIAPLVILVDDLHDADQASLRMVRFIARQTKDARILMIGTYRDSEVRQSRDLGELVGDLIREGHLIPIAGLSQTEVGQLVESALGHAAKEKMVVELCRATDGNPLFVDGVMRLLAAEGKLDRESLESLAIKTPDGVRESVRRRMAMLSPETVSILSIASVIGNEFEARLLEQVSRTAAEQIVDRMDDASRAGIVIDRATRDSRYQFSHVLIRQALYEDLPARRRFEFHGLIGEVIEKVHTDDLQPHLAALAHHFREAGNTEKAIDYSIGAGNVAYTIFAYEEAGAHWRAALELLDEQGGGDRKRRARLLWRLGDQLVTSGRKAVEYLEEAAPLFEELDDNERE